MSLIVSKQVSVSIDQQLAELEREIHVREHVFPRWVNIGKLTADEAARKLACLIATRDTVRELIRNSDDLFPESNVLHRSRSIHVVL